MEIYFRRLGFWFYKIRPNNYINDPPAGFLSELLNTAHTHIITLLSSPPHLHYRWPLDWPLDWHNYIVLHPLHPTSSDPGRPRSRSRSYAHPIHQDSYGTLVITKQQWANPRISSPESWYLTAPKQLSPTRPHALYPALVIVMVGEARVGVCVWVSVCVEKPP
jgi:hypothetical protein